MKAMIIFLVFVMQSAAQLLFAQNLTIEVCDMAGRRVNVVLSLYAIPKVNHWRRLYVVYTGCSPLAMAFVGTAEGRQGFIELSGPMQSVVSRSGSPLADNDISCSRATPHGKRARESNALPASRVCRCIPTLTPEGA